MPLDLKGLRRHCAARFRLACLLKRPLYLGIEDQPFFPHAHPHATTILLVRSAENVFASRLARSDEGHPSYPGDCRQLLQRGPSLDSSLRVVLDSVLADPRLAAAQRNLNALHGC